MHRVWGKLTKIACNCAEGQVDLYFTNFTRFCVNDTWPANVMIRSAAGGPAPWLESAGPVTSHRTLGINERLATSSAELAPLLRDPTVAGVRLVSTVQVHSVMFSRYCKEQWGCLVALLPRSSMSF